MARQYMPKTFHDPNKNPPTYLMYGPLCKMFLKQKNPSATLNISDFVLHESQNL